MVVDDQELHPMVDMPFPSAHSAVLDKSGNNTTVCPAYENSEYSLFSQTDISDLEKASTHLKEF